ncbi:hypothetical protein LCGC14_2178180 [marine sediment metagenome]|uniref:Uncharacterized protein n=1 Tax=marine sediment metagenome TaxID=412755 RepID=A0A0F9DN32_9ZZZZ
MRLILSSCVSTKLKGLIDGYAFELKDGSIYTNLSAIFLFENSLNLAISFDISQCGSSSTMAFFGFADRISE